MTASTRTPSAFIGEGIIESFGEGPPIVKRVMFAAGITLKHNPPRLELLTGRNRVITAPAVGLYACAGGDAWYEIQFSMTGARRAVAPARRNRAAPGGDRSAVALNSQNAILQEDVMRIHQRQGDLYPDDDETYEDFMDRCTDEIGDEDVCQLIWDDRGAKDVCHKTHASKVNGLEFVLSDETPDRMGDVIMADGWDLTNFQKNPIALFGHNSNFPIGKWKNLRVVDKQLRGFLELAPAGTSERIDEIRKLIDADILRAVSVGFRPKASRPRPESDYGVFFTKAELLETSLVSVPANPNALAVAKSLNISPATIDLVFAGKGNGNGSRRRGFTGGHADTSSRMRKGATMSSFAQRITAAEQRLNGLRDQLNEHWTKTDETNVSDEQLKTANELTEKITQEERTLAALRDAERNLATTSDDGRDATTGRALVPARTAQSSIVLGHGTSPARPFSAPPPKKLTAIDHLVRAGTIQLLAHRDRVPFQQKMLEIYGDDEVTRAVLEWSMRAATAPAMTTQTGWAAELVQTAVRRLHGSALSEGGVSAAGGAWACR